MLMRLSAIAMGMCLAMSVLTAQAAVYKWKDADGRVHYGDQAKAGAEKVNAGPSNAEAAPAEDADADSDAAKQKKKRAEECNLKRDQLANYTKATRIVETDSLGNQKEFNEDERKKLIERTQKQVSDSCGETAGGAAAN